jgi:ribosomal 50S subunit-associated protein YjgA (DUF615 family)
VTYANETADQPEVSQSRAERKRELAACRVKVMQLLLLNERELGQTGLPPQIVEALLAGKSLGRGNARPRQIRYLTRLIDELNTGGCE